MGVRVWGRQLGDDILGVRVLGSECGRELGGKRLGVSVRGVRVRESELGVRVWV